jgi:hypothetical protein
MFDLGDAILSLVEYVTTPPKVTEPKPVATIPQIAYKIVLCSVVAWLVQFILVGIFNSANHPLVDFPGPKWAAFTEWYKTYQELFRGRSWILVLEELHKKYGTFKIMNTIAQVD